jgi:hypothetical protein
VLPEFFPYSSDSVVYDPVVFTASKLVIVT